LFCPPASLLLSVAAFLFLSTAKPPSPQFLFSSCSLLVSLLQGYCRGITAIEIFLDLVVWNLFFLCSTLFILPSSPYSAQSLNVSAHSEKLIIEVVMINLAGKT